MNQTPHGYVACLLASELGGEPVDGRIKVSQLQVQFVSETISLDIPLEALEVEFEDGGPGIFFNDASRPEVKIFTRDQAILRQPVIRANARVAALLGRRELKRAIRLTACFAIGCILVVWLGSMAMSAMAGAIAARVPMEWEKKIGAEALQDLQTGGMLLNDSNDVAQLTALAAPLVQVLPAGRRDLKFYISSDPDANAFAAPGGVVVVNAGMLQMAGQPEELLGVLAHELAHQTKRHVIRHAIAAAGPLVIFGLFLHSDSGVGNILTLGSGMMVFQGFSQDYEMEADDTGWDYLVAANIDPRGMIRMFKKLEAAENKESHGAAPQALQSHPTTQKRIARLERKWDKMPRKTGFIELPPVKWSLKPAING